MGLYDYMDEDPTFDVARYKFQAFSSKQAQFILAENRKKNGGSVKSDIGADDYHVWLSGSTPADDSPEIDHIHPKSKGGSNEYKNAQVTSRKYNNQKRASTQGASE